MNRVILTDAAQAAVNQIQGLGFADSTVIVITLHNTTDTCMATFISKESLNLLKTSLIGDAFPGLEVHLFGSSRKTLGNDIEIDITPIRSINVLKKYASQNRDKTSLSYFFKITARQKNPKQLA